MKKYQIFLLILFLCLIKSFTTNKFNFLRNLWEEEMEYIIYNQAESDSLIHCSNSNYKYFSFILTGAPVSFDHFVPKDRAVSINNI